jgi:glycosyltransferase involved in cell wall biosynthesis
MRIALVTDGIWPYVLGGMQKHSYYLCRYLARKQIHVDLYHFNSSGYDISKLEFFSEAEKQYIHSIIVEFPKLPALPGHYIRASRKHSQLIYNRMLPVISTYDFIYTKGFTGWHLLEQKTNGSIKSARIGVKFHGYEMFQRAPGMIAYLRQILLLRAPVKKISRMADVVFSYGGKITAIIRSLGVNDKKIVEIPAGIEQGSWVDSIKKTGEQINFVFLGRYERRKGLEELNIAINKLEKAGSAHKYRFHFIGPIPGNKQSRSPNAVYHGETRDKDKLASLLHECDVLICPSWSEGMPNVILEAMSSALAVVGTDTGATSLLVNKETGWLLKNPDPANILLVLQQVLDEGAFVVDQKKRAALLHIKEFTWEKTIGKLVALMAGSL